IGHGQIEDIAAPCRSVCGGHTSGKVSSPELPVGPLQCCSQVVCQLVKIAGPRQRVLRSARPREQVLIFRVISTAAELDNVSVVAGQLYDEFAPSSCAADFVELARRSSSWADHR